MNELLNQQLQLNRRHFFGRSAAGLGVAALASLLNEDVGQAFQPDANRQIAMKSD